jgi:uncharacterized protein (UPF0276 family)
VEELLARRPDLAWLEVHPENYMADHRAFTRLQRVREHYPLSFHGVALSLGSDGELDGRHLSRLTQLIDSFEPFSVSEHLSWSATGGSHLNDLLPLPYTEEALQVVVRHVDQVQSALRRTILIENPSSYLRFKHSTISEAEFLGAVVKRTGCGLLCDVNNIYVSAHNLGADPEAYLKTLPEDAIREFHLAGHSRNEVGGVSVLIDDHASCVCGEVWELYSYALNHIGERPTLIEWDADLPPLDVLIGEAKKARHIAEDGRDRRHAVAA